jgi:DNA sulfur modification protein DndD
MILKCITLNNFGIFSGSQSISLCPKPGKNIVLFGGKNGAGKSTLLEAVRLCFYGQFAGRDLQTAASYDKYLLSRIHTNPSAVIQPTSAAIEVEFEYADSGSVYSYSILRSWEKRNVGSRVDEVFVLKRNGEVVKELEAEHWQDFVRDLIPAGISQLFFFDGEKIQHLAEDQTDQMSLGESIKALLGLDIIERLQADLAIYKSRSLKNSQIEGSDKLDHLHAAIEQLRAKMAAVDSDRHATNESIVALRSEISGVEQALTNRGGAFSKNRDRLLRRRSELKTRIDIHELTVRQVAGTFLPFLIAMPLCDDLMTQLQREDEVVANRALKTKLARVRNEFRVAISRPKLWAGLGINSPTRGTNAILEALDNVLAGAVHEQTARAVHKVSASERDQMIVWIDDAMRVKPTLQHIGTELEQFYRELQKCERELARVPLDEVLKPFIDQLSGLHLQLGKATSALSTLEERARAISTEIDELQRRLKRETDEVASRAKANLNLERASDIHAVLDEYREALMRRKVQQLQDAISECFNLLSRKKDAVRTLRIDPTDFSVHLQDRNQRPLAKSELSAGEKQIYAIAVLWGLAKISGRPLPMIVDTPLARLDSDHRQLLAENYFPQASQQVIVLSTDTEIDCQYFEVLRKHVSHSYMLEYVPEENGTVVKEGYFWNEVN